MTAEPERGAAEERLRDAIDRGRAGDKVPMRDPAAAPLGTDDEAAGQRSSARAAALAQEQETGRRVTHTGTGNDANSADRNRPSLRPFVVVMALLVAIALAAYWLA